MKKINNYHLYILILIVFILNTILFRSIDLTFAQFPSPPGTPGEQTTNIVVNPLQEDLDLGGQSIIGDGNVNIDGLLAIRPDPSTNVHGITMEHPYAGESSLQISNGNFESDLAHTRFAAVAHYNHFIMTLTCISKGITKP